MKTKTIGNIGLGEAIAYFTRNGMRVSIPLNDSQPYDLIVDNDGVLARVSVKTTLFARRPGSYEVGLCTKGGTQGTDVQPFDNTTVEMLFIHAGGINYLMPAREIQNKKTITVGNGYQEYRVN